MEGFVERIMPCESEYRKSDLAGLISISTQCWCFKGLACRSVTDIELEESTISAK
jgi:hypothetical protein